MSETGMNVVGLVVALVAGLLLGAFFFCGLWWTVQRALGSKAPAAWFLASLAMRTGVTVGGFYLVSAGHWERLLSCLIGFVVARKLVVRVTHVAGEAEHAS